MKLNSTLSWFIQGKLTLNQDVTSMVNIWCSSTSYILYTVSYYNIVVYTVLFSQVLTFLEILMVTNDFWLPSNFKHVLLSPVHLVL